MVILIFILCVTWLYCHYGKFFAIQCWCDDDRDRNVSIAGGLRGGDPQRVIEFVESNHYFFCI